MTEELKPCPNPLEALQEYRDTYCEGWCQDYPAGYFDPNRSEDCGGCLARRVLHVYSEGR